MTSTAIACDEFVWHQTTKIRCHSCGLSRDDHVDGWISRRPADPEFEAYLNQPCDEDGCTRTANHDGTGKNTGKRGKWCNQHCDWNQPAFARND